MLFYYLKINNFIRKIWYYKPYLIPVGNKFSIIKLIDFLIIFILSAPTGPWREW